MSDGKETKLPGEDFARLAEEEAEIERAYARKITEAALANYDARVAAEMAEKAKRQQASVRALTMLVFGAEGYNYFDDQIEK